MLERLLLSPSPSPLPSSSRTTSAIPGKREESQGEDRNHQLCLSISQQENPQDTTEHPSAQHMLHQHARLLSPPRKGEKEEERKGRQLQSAPGIFHVINPGPCPPVPAPGAGCDEHHPPGSRHCPRSAGKSLRETFFAMLG